MTTLSTTFPEQFHTAAKQAQAVVIPNLAGNPIACSMLPVPFPVPTLDECQNVAEGMLTGAIQNGGIARGLTATQISALKNAVGDSHFKPGQWLCAPVPQPSDCSRGAGGGGGTTPPDDTPVCQFVIPAKRLNVYPDEAELVWFDSEDEFTNPALALFFATFALPTGAGQAARDQLCAFNPQSAFFDRPLSAVSVHL